MSANSWLAGAACSCLLLLGCASLGSPGSTPLPAATQPKGPLNKTESQAAIERIDALRYQAQCDQALSLWQQGHSQESRRLLSQVLTRNAGHPLARRLLADLALEAGDMREAEQLLVGLTHDHPDDKAARAALAWLYESQGREQEAKSLFRQLDADFSPDA